jgi:5'-nucleotidase
MHESKEVLTIGVSTRALFDLEKENDVFENMGIEKFRDFQQENEGEILDKGTAFFLVKHLLELNRIAGKTIVEVVVMSRNSPETGLRVLNSIAHHRLGITRLALTGGKALSPYIEAYGIDLFLSRDEHDVQRVIDSEKCAAALVYEPPVDFNPSHSQVKIAFDADAVLFSEESEVRYKTEGLDAFQKHENENQHIPMNEGPFANLLRKLSMVQKQLPQQSDESALRLAIVTARSAPSHMRVINTLRHWGVNIDEIYFMGGLSKDSVLKAFGAHIFFDDQATHVDPASKVVPSGRVPYTSESPMQEFNKTKKQ